MTRWTMFALFALALSPGAAAQSPDGHRAFIVVNGGVQPTVTEFDDAATFAGPSLVYTDLVSGAATREPSSFDGAYRVDSGSVIDIGGGARLWRWLGAGAAVSLSRRDAVTDIAARLPHPFFLENQRTVTASDLPLARDELAVHLRALVVLPVRSALTVTIFGGPTLFKLTQGLVTDVRFEHAYPYDSAAFEVPVTQQQSGSKVGFNVGADIAYYFTETLGAGWLTSFSRATVELPSVGGDLVGVPAGGVHAVGGLRLRF